MKEFNILIEELDKITEKCGNASSIKVRKAKISMIASYAQQLCMRLSELSKPQIDVLPKKDKRNLTN